MRTVEAIIKDSITDGLELPRTGIQNDVILEAVSKYNFCGRTIWDMWPWDSKKIDQFDTSDSTYVASFDTTTGIIMFTATVDLIKAVQAAAASSGNDDTFVWNESEVNAAMIGKQVSSGNFTKLSDTSAGLRRIRVQVSDNVSTYKVLATKRFTEAVVDAAYSSGNPSATPTDYRVLIFPIDKADQSLEAYIADQLRLWDGQPARDEWGGLLRVAIGTVENQEQRSRRFFPAGGDFSNVGEFEYGGDYGYRKTY